MPPKFSLVKLLRQKFIPNEQNVNFVLQDFGFKLQDLKVALQYIHEQTEVYPIWLCPTRHVIHKGLENILFLERKIVMWILEFMDTVQSRDTIPLKIKEEWNALLLIIMDTLLPMLKLN